MEMHPETTAGTHDRRLDDLPTVGELSLARAVVQYRDAQELYGRHRQIHDIGLAVVTDGRAETTVRAIDLGSAGSKYLNLASELVILDWVYDATLARLKAMASFARNDTAEDARQTATLRRHCFDLALRVLGRSGFTPLTRPTLLRIGFRDICKDLDLHESATVRIATAPGEVAHVSLDYDANALLLEPVGRWPCHATEEAIREVFGGSWRRSTSFGGAGDRWAYEVRFGVPVTFSELHASLASMRSGLSRLAARFEPDRHRSVRRLIATFGERRTLDRIPAPVGEGGPGQPRMAVH